jgi:hypothetical protein
VLAIHRHDLPAAAATGRLDQGTGNDERLLVRESNALPALECAKRGIEPGGPDDGIEHDVHVVTRRGLDQARRSGVPRRHRRCVAIDETDERRRVNVGLLAEQGGIPERGEGADGEAVLLAREHTKRRRPDRPGGSEHRDAAPSHRPPGAGTSMAPSSA